MNKTHKGYCSTSSCIPAQQLYQIKATCTYFVAGLSKKVQK